MAESLGPGDSAKAAWIAGVGAVVLWIGHMARSPLGSREAESNRSAGTGEAGEPDELQKRFLFRLGRPPLILLALLCGAVFFAWPTALGLTGVVVVYVLVDIVLPRVGVERELTELGSRRLLGALSVLALLMLTLGVLVLTTGRHLIRWYALEDSTVPTATDLATYYWGPVVRFDHHANPYSNEEWRDLLAAGAFDLGHPNPMMTEVIERNIAGERLGYVASPFDLLLFRGLNLFPFRWIYALWPLLSLLTLSASVAFLSFALSRRYSRRLRLIGSLFAVYLLVLVYEPALSSAVGFGQLEGLYVPLVIAAMGWLLLDPARRSWLAGTALAFAAAIKIFPAVVGLALLFRAREKAMRRALLAAVVVGVVLSSMTTLLVGLDTVGAWITKIGSEPFVREARWRHDLAAHYQFATERWSGVPSSLPTAVRFGFAAALWVLGWRMVTRRPVFDQGWRVLYLGSFSLVVLPTMMPLWWNLYHVVLAIPFLVCFWSLVRPLDMDGSDINRHEACAGSKQRPGRWLRITAMIALAVAYCGLNAYTFLDDILGQVAPEVLGSLPGLFQRAIAECVGYPATLSLFLALLLSYRFLSLSESSQGSAA